MDNQNDNKRKQVRLALNKQLEGLREVGIDPEGIFGLSEVIAIGNMNVEGFDKTLTWDSLSKVAHKQKDASRIKNNYHSAAASIMGEMKAGTLNETQCQKVMELFTHTVEFALSEIGFAEKDIEETVKAIKLDVAMMQLGM